VEKGPVYGFGIFCSLEDSLLVMLYTSHYQEYIVIKNMLSCYEGDIIFITQGAKEESNNNIIQVYIFYIPVHSSVCSPYIL